MAQGTIVHFQAPLSSLKAYDLPHKKSNPFVLSVLHHPSTTMESCKTASMEYTQRMETTILIGL